MENVKSVRYEYINAFNCQRLAALNRELIHIVEI